MTLTVRVTLTMIVKTSATAAIIATVVATIVHNDNHSYSHTRL